MMAKILFFPVGNGDMTLVEFESGKQLLIDMDIRQAADDPDDDTFDVATDLRSRLRRENGRLYVDAILISHPDKDHCTGLNKHFHLGHPDDWSEDDDKIMIRQMWSSPMVFRRASKEHVLCDDALAYNAEARRRVSAFRKGEGSVDGNRILILGEDENGKTDDLGEILIRTHDVFSHINGVTDDTFSIRLLAPMPKDDDEAIEDVRSKNHSSTILQISMSAEGVKDVCKFLTAGDAEVAIWDMLWNRHKDARENLQYHILQAPHHCSWHSLSYDSWSQNGENAESSPDARSALGQALTGATIIASCKPIEDDGKDPPCIGAKREYEIIAKNAGGTFVCVGDQNGVYEITINRNGAKNPTLINKNISVISSGAVGSQPLGHGN
ncbi:MAG: metallohydrolase [Micavibrio aeruginosavorus]|uniref:Metallohydrolase n=1 Tax=Micavibrio aeruginosavorus TaxID=349221 RepID=A0A2W5HMH8_9BACT|nr:MAG: metallohydrolase [Micavibrio aeruginosavorus]